MPVEGYTDRGYGPLATGRTAKEVVAGGIDAGRVVAGEGQREALLAGAISRLDRISNQIREYADGMACHLRLPPPPAPPKSESPMVLGQPPLIEDRADWIHAIAQHLDDSCAVLERVARALMEI